MLKRLLNRMYLDQKGITGLETAIILIAFVVVAAVFAYTVLSAGLFATDQSSEAVYSGLEETKSTLELRGGVTAYMSASETGDGTVEDIDASDGSDITTAVGTDVVTRIQFTVANVLGGDPIDLSPYYTHTTAYVDPPGTLAVASPDSHRTIVTYQDKYNYFSNCAWTVDWIGNSNEDNLLEANEKALITVWLIGHDASRFNLTADSSMFFDDIDDAAGHLLGTNDEFTIEVKSPKGAVLTMTRSLPANLDAVNDLH